MVERVKFRGIDRFNRPVFKSIDKKSTYYGSVNTLFSYGATEKEVLAKITEADLTYFGKSFGCEPWGTPTPTLAIVKES